MLHQTGTDDLEVDRRQKQLPPAHQPLRNPLATKIFDINTSQRYWSDQPLDLSQPSSSPVDLSLPKPIIRKSLFTSPLPPHVDVQPGQSLSPSTLTAPSATPDVLSAPHPNVQLSHTSAVTSVSSPLTPPGNVVSSPMCVQPHPSSSVTTSTAPFGTPAHVSSVRLGDLVAAASECDREEVLDIAHR